MAKTKKHTIKLDDKTEIKLTFSKPVDSPNVIRNGSNILLGVNPLPRPRLDSGDKWIDPSIATDKSVVEVCDEVQKVFDKKEKQS